MALSMSDRELVSKKKFLSFHATLMVFKTQLILEMVPEFDLF